MVSTSAMIDALRAAITASEVRAACKSRSIFLGDTPLGVLCILIFFLLPCAAGINAYLINMSDPKLLERIQTMALPKHEPRPQSVNPPETPPPVYAEHPAHLADDSAAEDHPSSYTDVQWSINQSDGAKEPVEARQFVIGTTLFAALLFLLVLLAADIQALSYCWASPAALNIVMWIIYGGLCLFSLHGLGAWLVLFRNLWGKKGKERVVLKHDVIIKWVFALLRLPYGLAVALVSGLQNRCCGAEEEEDQDVELGVTPSSATFPPTTNLPKEAEEQRRKEEAKVDAEEADEAIDERTAEQQGLLAVREQGSSS